MLWTGGWPPWEQGGDEEAGAGTQERPGGVLEVVAAMEVQRRRWTEKILTGNGEDCD